MPLIRALLLALLSASAAAAEPAWIAERGDVAQWPSNAGGRPVALARATRKPPAISVNLLCTIENGRPVLRLHYRDADRIAERDRQPAIGARVDGDAPIELEHVDRADWQSQALSSAFIARLRAGSFLVLERRQETRLGITLRDAGTALDRLAGMCVP